MNFRPQIMLDTSGYLLGGLGLTVGLSVAAILIGFVLGGLGATLRRARIAPLRWLVAAYVAVFRSTPALIQLYLVFFGLPAIGLRFDPLPAALVTLSLYTGAYLTEILRAGIESVPVGQTLAARSIGMSQWQTFRHVIAPQAVRNVMPPLASQIIDTTLTSSLAALIGLFEVTGRGLYTVALNFRPFEIYMSLGIIYLAITIAMVFVFGQIEQRLGGRRRVYVLPTDILSTLPQDPAKS